MGKSKPDSSLTSEITPLTATGAEGEVQTLPPPAEPAAPVAVMPEKKTPGQWKPGGPGRVPKSAGGEFVRKPRNHRAEYQHRKEARRPTVEPRIPETPALSDSDLSQSFSFICYGVFDLLSRLAKAPKWKLSANESLELGVAVVPLARKYQWLESVGEYGPEVGFGTVALRIILARLSVDADSGSQGNGKDNSPQKAVDLPGTVNGTPLETGDSVGRDRESLH